MITTLYEPFRHWSDGGSIFILSDLHFDDDDCKLMGSDWITPEEQVAIINKTVGKNDTFVCLGDVGSPKYIPMIHAKKKILLLGNHDARGAYKGLFTEIYSGPLFIADKFLLSHEPVYGLSWCLNIHGHDHNSMEPYKEGCKHINLAANVCGYTPVSLGKLIKEGVLSDIEGIHRKTIDRATEKKQTKKQKEATEGISEEASKDCLNDLAELCSAMNGIYDMAYREYKPLVEDACHREMTEENLCHLMDRLMDFACEERCLGLFKQLCRHYYSRYPEVITDYIGLYRELWDDETEEDENEGSCDT